VMKDNQHNIGKTMMGVDEDKLKVQKMEGWKDIS
jgi:hypothetical protein